MVSETKELGCNGSSGREGKIEVPHKAASLSERINRKKDPKRPREMTGNLAFLCMTSNAGNNLKPEAGPH